MASITGQAGSLVTQQLSQYLTQNANAIDVNSVVNILNASLAPQDRIGPTSTTVVTQGIYKKFTDNDIINNSAEIVTEGIWSNGEGILTTFFTGSTVSIAGQSGSDASKYYYNIYLDSTDTGSGAPVEFAVAYGHKQGSGSIQLVTSDSSTNPTKATYSQYRILLNNNFEGDIDDYFTFYSGSIEDSYLSKDIYVVNISRARYRQYADAGNFSLNLSGSNGLFTFVDDSGKKFSDKKGKSGTVFNIVSGSINLGTESEATIVSYTASNGQGFGKFYTTTGIVVLNPTAISNVVGSELAPVVTALPTAETYNHAKLYDAIKKGKEFQMRRTETISTQHFFVRATNKEFNFSNNPTYVSGSIGAFREPSFEDDPKTFITTIGLYNDANELIAVAKTSQPIAKDFAKEVLVKVKLSF